MPEYKPCPNCNEKIEQDAVLCKYCGLNVETGESYPSRMERAKTYRKQTGTEHKSLAFGFLILFAMVLIGGFIYQGRSSRALKEAPKKYLGYVKSLEKADRLLATKDYEGAREELNQLIEQMEEDKAQLEDEDASESEEHIRERRALLSNLIAKATKKLNSIPSEETEQPE